MNIITDFIPYLNKSIFFGKDEEFLEYKLMGIDLSKDKILLSNKKYNVWVYLPEAKKLNFSFKSNLQKMDKNQLKLFV